MLQTEGKTLESAVNLENDSEKNPSKNELQVKKRNGSVVTFNEELIHNAIKKAFHADRDIPFDAPLDDFLLSEVKKISDDVVQDVKSKVQTFAAIGIEQIQDTVEMKLMHYGHYSVARRLSLIHISEPTRPY